MLTEDERPLSPRRVLFQRGAHRCPSDAIFVLFRDLERADLEPKHEANLDTERMRLRCRVYDEVFELRVWMGAQISGAGRDAYNDHTLGCCCLQQDWPVSRINWDIWDRVS